MKVYLLPKADFHKTYGLFSTNYGSVDNHFGFSPEALHRVPDGIAHFLEHKLFEKKTAMSFKPLVSRGRLPMPLLVSRKPATFSATDQIKLNLETLIDFVQAPYFTEETVEKKKGSLVKKSKCMMTIQTGSSFGIIKNLYPKHPLHIDIAGTVESIAQITAEDLYLCYNTFYHPSNMTLLW